MDKYLEVLNKLQDVFTRAGISTSEIDLPQIVVVGSQSAGKSSVLESIARLNFLPRGGGIVTRRPLILQMIQEKQELEVNGKKYSQWARFLHSEEIFLDPKKICQEITNDTIRVCGNNKGISDKAIHLKLHSISVPSLTLVDLPGLTKIPVGDQPTNISKTIERLVRSYVSKGNSIILAVSPGNVDIANSESLQLAREVDPEGRRTLAVITKCDLMELGRESTALLSGASVDVALGLIGVINRNTNQLAVNLPFYDVLKIEEDYFATHYDDLFDRMGTQYLTERLSDILIDNVKRSLPSLSEKITNLTRKHKAILDSVGQVSGDPRRELITTIQKFTTALERSIDGNYPYPKTVEKKDKDGTIRKVKDEENPVTAGGEIRKVFKLFYKKMGAVKADQGLDDLKTYIKDCGTVDCPLFLQDKLFHALIVRQIRLLDQPLEEAIRECNDCLDGCIDDIAESAIQKYPALAMECVRIAKEELQNKATLTRTFLSEYLENECSHVNGDHPEFVDRYAIAGELFKEETEQQSGKDSPGNYSHTNKPLVESKLEKIMAKHQYGDTKSAADRENNEAELLQKLIIMYFCIVRSQLNDSAIKTIMRHMVRDLVSTLKATLIMRLYSGEPSSLVIESASTKRRRDASTRMYDALIKAQQLLTNILGVEYRVLHAAIEMGGYPFKPYKVSTHASLSLSHSLSLTLSLSLIHVTHKGW
eukprot:sb/3479400/